MNKILAIVLSLVMAAGIWFVATLPARSAMEATGGECQHKHVNCDQTYFNRPVVTCMDCGERIYPEQ